MHHRHHVNVLAIKIGVEAFVVRRLPTFGIEPALLEDIPEAL
jgi:hypothetical protein